MKFKLTYPLLLALSSSNLFAVTGNEGELYEDGNLQESEDITALEEKSEVSEDPVAAMVELEQAANEYLELTSKDMSPPPTFNSKAKATATIETMKNTQ